MKPIQILLTVAVLGAASGAPLVVRHYANARLQTAAEKLRNEAALASSLVISNQVLSNAAPAESSQSLSPKQVSELARLRNEAGKLRQAEQEMDQLDRDNERLRAQWQNADAELRHGRDRPTALLSEVMDIRRARVAQIKQWLDANPGQKIPELAALHEMQWIEKVEFPLIIDQDYLVVASILRGDAQMPFDSKAMKALKAYARANSGQFPTDLSQLKPYFAPSVDDAILQRYEIVPANTLCKVLANVGGEYVITQKAPINRQMDARSAIGATNFMSSVASQGVWDPPQ